MFYNITLILVILHLESNGFFLFFLKILQTRPKPWAFIWFLQIDILMHVTFVYKWYFWDDFWTSLKLFSPIRFHEWIFIVVSTLFSYCTRSHSTLNYTCPWNGPPFIHDQTFKWSLSHCHWENFVLVHKLCFIMFLILWCFCNTFLPAPI
jgi:hypothetical protein